MGYTIKFIGGPRAGQVGLSSSVPRVIQPEPEEKAAGYTGSHLRKEVDEVVASAVYQWQEV